MCCRNKLSKSKELDIIEKGLERLEELERMLDSHDFKNMFKNCSKLEPLPENKELEKEYYKLKEK